MRADNLTDDVLWSEMRAGDAGAFNVLFDRYWSKIFTTAFKYVQDREACADVVHDIFLNLWQSREHLHIQSFGAYVQAAARYHVFKKLKAAKSSVVTYTAEEVELPGAAQNKGETKLLQQEMEGKLETYVQQLPSRCREIFLLSRRDQLTNEEIAGKLGISRRTVENQLTYALRHLRTTLKDLPVLLILWECGSRW